MANSTRHTEAPGVEGHTLRGQDAPNSTQLPIRDTAPQVMMVYKPLVIILSEGTVGRSTQQDLG